MLFKCEIVVDGIPVDRETGDFTDLENAEECLIDYVGDFNVPVKMFWDETGTGVYAHLTKSMLDAFNGGEHCFKTVDVRRWLEVVWTMDETGGF